MVHLIDQPDAVLADAAGELAGIAEIEAQAKGQQRHRGDDRVGRGQQELQAAVLDRVCDAESLELFHRLVSRNLDGATPKCFLNT